jgi:hypothetical protein
VKIKNVTTNGSNDKLYTAAEELARNTGAAVGIIKAGETIKQINIDYLGTYAGGGGAATPDTPVGLYASSTKKTTVTLRWNDAPRFDYYKVAIDGVEQATQYTNSEATITTIAGTTYAFKVKAVNSTGASAWTAAISVTTRTDGQVERDGWSQFKTQLQADVNLAAYVTKFKFNRIAEQVQENAFPLLVAFVSKAIDEEYSTVPLRKFTTLQIIVSGKIKSSGDTVESELLKFDEYIKNAIESDIQLGGKGTIVHMGDSEFNYLNDDGIAEVNITVNLKLVQFLAGSR